MKSRFSSLSRLDSEAHHIFPKLQLKKTQGRDYFELLQPFSVVLVERRKPDISKSIEVTIVKTVMVCHRGKCTF